MSWLEEQERILSISEVPYREPMHSLKCYFFYINMNNYIHHVDMEELDIGSEGVLGSDKLLNIIQSKKIYTANTKYLFQDLFLFHIDLEPDEIQGFIGCDMENFGGRFFRKVSMVDDIIIPPSIGVFHSVNSLYFFFHESFLRKAREPKSILKIGGFGGGACKNTKRRGAGTIGGSFGTKTTRKVAWK